MKCGKAVKLISDYVDGHLDEVVAGEFESHVTSCPECDEELQATQDLLSRLRSLSACECPTDCWDRVRVSSSVRRRTPERPWFLRGIFAAPSLAVVILLALMLWPKGAAQPVSNAVSVSEYARYVAAHSRIERQQALADPDVAFAGMELEKADLLTVDVKR